jgi:hypothetical protein
MHCGTGCVGHYSINVKDGSYQIFCIGTGQLEWAPDRKIGVAENYGSGPDPHGWDSWQWIAAWPWPRVPRHTNA